MSAHEDATIRVASREDVLYLLAEAAAIEHNLMCCYLYAAFSLKSQTDEGLTAHEADATARWRAAIIDIAIEEMSHLSLVANLVCALGARPNFDRPNFPVPPGFHPDEMVVRLAPFNIDTLDHFIFLERPVGSEVTDGASFCGRTSYQRVAGARRVMPSSQDFSTVGDLYAGVRAGLDTLASALGEKTLFCGSPAHQLSPGIVSLPGLCVVKDLASAHTAIDTIVNQGEGSPEDRKDSHFSKFQAIKAEYRQLLASNRGFTPGRPVAENPVMRKPSSDAENRVFIDEPLAALGVDFANALYGQMLRLLVQAFGRAEPAAADQALLIDAAISMMQCLAPVAIALTVLPASCARPGITAGMTFTMLRNLSPVIECASEWNVMSGRIRELAQAASEVALKISALSGIDARLKSVADQLAKRGLPAEKRAALEEPEGHDTPPPAPRQAAPGVETVKTPDITLYFDASRCIHSRFCVLWQPEVYKANTTGPWIDPSANRVEAVVAVAQNCPSGAIQYSRHDADHVNEQPPPVNLLNMRENGPLAVRAEMYLDSEAIGFRATFCRCGQSKNKPFCDNSHREVPFIASGEATSIDSAALAIRNGALQIAPQRNGPLRLLGNLEICTGTGRTVKRSTAEALCRCGHSANKPFCDGSHARVGFVAD